jgi:pimeloyl-ACP methyl ester carboxylesterase
MPTLVVSGEIRIAYEVVGETLEGKPPIVLVHGFASNRVTNWRAPGWYEALTQAGRQVIAFDVRGHGESDKPHDPDAYNEGELAWDVERLLDHLGHAQADVMGYSMGGFITLRLLHDSASRVRRGVIAGVGENYYGRGTVETDAIAAGLRAPSAADVVGAVPRQFRLFAEQGKNDLEALALCMTRERRTFAAAEFEDLNVPTLIVVGEKDTVTGPPDLLAAALPGSHVVIVPGRDHMTCVGDKIYKAAVLSFLDF